MEAERHTPGNVAAMCKALKEINRVVWDKKRHTKEETEAHRLATEALTVPPRQCDVGTVEEQEQRYKAIGEVYHTLTLKNALAFAHTPYAAEKGAGE